MLNLRVLTADSVSQMSNLIHWESHAPLPAPATFCSLTVLALEQAQYPRVEACLQTMPDWTVTILYLFINRFQVCGRPNRTHPWNRLVAT